MPSHSVAVLPFVLLLAAPMARAQCPTDWLPGDPFTGLIGNVTVSLMHDPDAAGPLPARLLVGGASTIDGSGFAVWDPAARSWSTSLPSPGSVHSLAVLPNNDLVAAGDTYGPSGSSVVRWNGTAWVPLVGVHELSGPVDAMLVLPNGDIVVGGALNLLDPVTWWNGVSVARWDGTDWSSLSMPEPTNIISLAGLPNGDLLAVPTEGLHEILRWDGTSWTQFAPLVEVKALTVLANGDVVCSGSLAGNYGVHRWNGTAWTSLGNPGYVTLIRELPNGDLVATGSSGFPTRNFKLSRWSGSGWQQIASGPGRLSTITPLPSGSLFVGGDGIELANGDHVPAAEVVGNTFTGLGSTVATDGDVTLAVELSGGDMVVAGTFTRIGGVNAPGLARWNGTSWAPVGGRIEGEILDIAEMPNGDLVVCGEFAKADQAFVTNIARWNGVAWSSMGWTDPGFGAPRTIRALAVMPNGDLMIGGDFSPWSGLGGPRYVARYDGAKWLIVGLASSHAVRDMVVLPNGDLVVCGEFVAVEQPWLYVPGVPALRVARWDGSHWLPMGGGMNSRVDRVFLDARGDLIATGTFTQADGKPANGIARWDGASWSGIGAVAGWAASPMVAPLPDGDLVRIMGFPSPLERWDGATWTAFDANPVTRPKCLTALRNGHIFVGGTQFVHGAYSMGYGRLATKCPASATSFGGCPSSGGANHLVAEQLPYSKGVLRSLATGTSITAVVIVATGFTALSSPVLLSTFLPNAGASCSLAVAPDIVQGESAANGTVRSSLPIPAGPSLVGLSFFQQMVVLGTDPVLGIVESTATNALQLTVGSF